MRILITGGAGFVGSNLCQYLLDRGDEVICLDNLYTGMEQNIQGMLDNKNFKFVKHDITVPFSPEEKIDQIYNLACPASPPHYQRDPLFTANTCYLGMINMLELAKKNNARILQASTSEVYGDPEVHPQKETYKGCVNTFGPRACYDEGKRVAETLCYEYHHQQGVDIRIIRIFNTYGPNMDPNDGRVVSNFIIQTLKGEDLTVYGDGEQTRSFCYVSDLLDGMYKMMNQDGFTGPVNLGNPGEFTIKELADKVLALVGETNKLIHKDLPVDDPKQRRPDISLAKEKLDWQPQVTLDEGLVKTIKYFRDLLNK